MITSETKYQNGSFNFTPSYSNWQDIVNYKCYVKCRFKVGSKVRFQHLQTSDDDVGCGQLNLKTGVKLPERGKYGLKDHFAYLIREY